MNPNTRLGVLVEGTIGDSLILVPTLKAIEQHFDNSLIELISFTDNSSISAESVLRATFPDFKFSVIDNSSGRNIFLRLSAWLSLVRLIQRNNIKLLVYAFRPEGVRASTRAKWHRRLINLLTSSRTYGFDVDKWPVPDGDKQKDENLISKLLFERVIASLGLERKFNAADHKIEIGHADEAFAKAWLEQHFSSSTDRYYVVCVSGKTKAQCWPIQRYKEVMLALYRSHGLTPILLGSPKEVNSHDRLISAMGVGYSLAGSNIGQSAAVMRGAQFYLGNDTGPMHLAAALDLRCIVLQSARNLIGTWDPLGDGHQIFRNRPSCAGCGLNECNLEEQLCLTNIPVDQVIVCCQRLLSPEDLLQESKI